MKQRQTDRRYSLVAVGALTLWLVASTGSAAAPTFDNKGWLEGADGLINGIELAKKDSKPLLVYFFADWCGYCRQAEQQLLSKPEFQTYLKSGRAVMINPDDGERENGIARYYRIQGYPSFLVYGRDSGRLISIERHRMVRGKPQLLSPAAFVERIRQASAQ